MVRVQFRVLGPVDIASARQQAVVSSSARRRGILAVLLAARGEVVAGDRLLDAVWRGRPPPSAGTTLRSHVAQLRRGLDLLEPGSSASLVTVTGGYRLDLDGHELDAGSFEAAVGEAERLRARSPERSSQLLEAALGRWRGPAFGELADLDGVRPEAVRLEALRATAAGDRADALLALGRHRELLGELRAQVLDDPLDERAHGQLVLALYRSGQQADALAAYRSLQERLRDELGVDPSPALRRLHASVLRQDDVLAVPLEPAGAEADDHRPTDLLGRDEDTESVAALVGGGRLVTLTGPGGVGKTRLADHVGHRLAGRFEDGVVLCRLSGARTVDDVCLALLDALVVPQPGGGAAEDVVVDAASHRRALLVLDCCEHVLPAVAGIVDRLLGSCRGVAVLATSQERLHLPGEQVWQVAPLQVPPAGADAVELAGTSAGALFLRRALAVDPAFRLADDAAAVAELCRRLDGLPLAIELAAARVGALTPRELTERLDRRFSLLTSGPPTDAGRHRTLRATADWSFRLLDPPEARLFDRLSVFPGAFRLAAAEEVCGGPPLDTAEVAGRLADLVDKSMVSAEPRPDGTRYRVLDTLRALGAEHLSGEGGEAAVRARHGRYHVAEAEHLGRLVCGRDEGHAAVRVDDLVEDLRAAHAWALRTGDVDLALRLPAGLHEYVLFRLRDEVTRWAARAVRLEGADGHTCQASALATAAVGATNRGDLALGRRQAEEALDRAGGDGLASLRATGVLSVVALYEGRLDEVLHRSERLTALSTAAGPLRGTSQASFYAALAHLNPAIALLYGGRAGEAAAHARELGVAAAASGAPTLLAWARYVHGETTRADDPTGAGLRLQTAVDLARRVGSRLPEGAALVSLASLYGRRGDTGRATELFVDAVRHWRRLGDRTHQLTTLRNVVELFDRAGADVPAAVLLGAVTGSAPPTFGSGTERLEAVWHRLGRRLGEAAAVDATRRGTVLGTDEAADLALETLELLARR